MLGGRLAIQGKLRIGDIQAFLQFHQFTQPITQTASIANVMKSRPRPPRSAYSSSWDNQRRPGSGASDRSRHGRRDR